ncbi:YicC/YloC family endoribonuclease [Virgibacillus sp. FSP13]
MARSMTGYGREVIHIENTMVTVEIRSVNHRFLDFHTKIPPTFLFLEEKMKEVVRSYFGRGRIEILIRIDGEGFVKKRLETDWDLMDQYMEQLKQVKERYQVTGEIPMTVFSQMPDLFSIQQTEEQSEQQVEVVIASLHTACQQVQKMREAEGEKLLADITNRMESIREVVSLLKTRRVNVVNEYRERIKMRVNDYLPDMIDVDSSHMYQEIALLAEKGDITEEITRLLSHTDHFFAIIKKDEQIGRKLDFILQEMHRETNTIGSKSTDVKISEWIVSLKSELEKIKEQVQNIE